MTENSNNNNVKEKKYLTENIVGVLPFTKVIFEKIPWLAQVIDFSMVGVINAVLSYLIYAILIYFSVHYQIANQVSYWLTVLNGYLLNKYWVFSNQSEKKSHTQTLRYFVLYGFNFVLGIVLMYLYVDVLHINKYIVPFISIPITIPLNYCLNRFWVFRNKKSKNVENSL